jgi:hypothetical protein
MSIPIALFSQAPAEDLVNALNQLVNAINAQLAVVGTKLVISGGTINSTAISGGTINSTVISGGTINSTVIGGTTPAAGNFTTLTAPIISGGIAITGDATIHSLTVGLGGGSIVSNTANGYQALYSNTTGSNNTANGYQALYSNTTGGNNAANGLWALFSNTTGSNNTANGMYAGYNNSVSLQTMSYSTFLGYGANSSIDGVTNSTAIGNGAQVTASNEVVIGNSSVTKTVLNGAIAIGGATAIGSDRSYYLPSYTVTTLPAAGTAGRMVFASNCRMFNGVGLQEGTGAGTGGLVTDNGTAWKIAGTNVTAIA